MFDTYLGLFAGLLTTSSLVPQVIKAWKTRSTKDISLIMLLMMWIGVLTLTPNINKIPTNSQFIFLDMLFLPLHFTI